MNQLDTRLNGDVGGSAGGGLSRRSVLLAGAVAALIPVAAACTIGDPDDPQSAGGGDGGEGGSPTSSGPPPDPATVTFEPEIGAKNINPTAAVAATNDTAPFDEITLVDAVGDAVAGQFTADRKGWSTTDPLAYDATYTLTARYTTEGVKRTKTSTFSTLKPTTLTMPYFELTSGNALTDGATYGVGVVPVVHWDEDISDRAAAEKTLTVAVNPPVEGGWYWATDRTVHWRPASYYKPGTTVSITVKAFGVEVSPGLWGQADQAIGYSIGDSHISKVDDNNKQVKVYINGDLVRSMPTSMGQGGTEVVGNQTLHFWTQSGIYTVLDKANPVVMDSSTYGLPINSRLGYKESIGWATRISNDGIYLHALADSIWAQGNTNVSHGCLNLSPDNAQWYFGISNVGDVVEIVNTGGPPLELWQNGDWTIDWATWKRGSAL